MSGSSSSLSSTLDSSLGAGSAILNTIYGGGSSSTLDPIQAMKSAELHKTQDLKVTAAQPAVQHAVKAFTQAVNSAKSLTQLLANPAVMKVLLTANGMTDQIGYTALATKVLTSKLSDPGSLANKLTDTRWKTLARTYNFASNGLSAIKNPKAIAAVAQAYVQATWVKSEDTVTPGLANALTFKAQASTITSVDQILGNPTFRTVVTVALGIPQQIAFQDLNAQEQAIQTRLDVTKFKSPKFVEAFTERYLIANTGTASAASSSPDLIKLAVQGRGILA